MTWKDTQTAKACEEHVKFGGRGFAFGVLCQQQLREPVTDRDLQELNRPQPISGAVKLTTFLAKKMFKGGKSA